MMKIGCCVNMVAEDAAGVGIDRIDVLVKEGFDYIELPMAQMMALSDVDFGHLVERVQKSGIPCLASNNFFPATMRLTGEAMTPKAELEKYIQKAIDRGLELGVKTIVFGSSGAKNIPENFPYDVAWEQVVLLLQLVDDCIDNRDICIAIEPLNREESNLILTAEEGLALAKVVQRPNIKLLIDFYHLSMENEDISIVLKGKEYLQHIHLANPIKRSWPKKGDDADYKGFLKALNDVGYCGGVSIEAFTGHFEIAAKEGYAAMKKILDEM